MPSIATPPAATTRPTVLMPSNVAEQQSTIAELKSAVAKQQATNAQQQQQIEALTAGLQKVSAAVELNKPALTQVADTR